MNERDHYISKATVAYMLNVDPRSVTTAQNRAADPLPIKIRAEKRGHQNYYCPQEILEWKVRQELAKLDVGSNGEILNLDAERARLAKAQADAKERENRIADGALAPIDVLEDALVSACSQITAIMGAIPMKLKHKAPHLKAREIDIVKKEIAKALNATSQATID